MVKLSVLTVTFNNQETIGRYLKSVLKFLPRTSELLILDNHSTDKTVDIIKKYSEVGLIESKLNLGFGKANNILSKKAKGKFLMFLNPDTEVRGSIFDELINYSEENPGVGIVSPKLVQPDGNTQASVRKLPTLFGAIKEYYFNDKFSYEAYVPNSEVPTEVESVVGAAILIRRELFLELRGFNEKYFMYYEDLDLCRKIKNIGLKIIYYPKVSLIHLVGYSKSEKKTDFLRESAIRYHGFIKFVLLKLILRLRPK